MPLGQQGPKTKTNGCAIARAFQFTSFDLLNHNTSKVTKEILVPSLCWAYHFLLGSSKKAAAAKLPAACLSFCHVQIGTPVFFGND